MRVAKLAINQGMEVRVCTFLRVSRSQTGNRYTVVELGFFFSVYRLSKSI